MFKSSNGSSDLPRSIYNSKYPPMPGEFIYRNRLWTSWVREEDIRTIENVFEFLPTDVLLCGYTKSGITFLSELTCLLVYSKGKEENLQYALDTVRKHRVSSRVPFLEANWTDSYPLMENKVQAMVYLNNVRETGQGLTPRLIKTHLPYDSIECALRRMEPGKRPKILYVYRNPKDVAVSFYHFYRAVLHKRLFQGDWVEFFEMWMDGWISGGDWRTIVPAWLNAAKASELTKILPVSYEQLVNNRETCVEQIHNFLFPNEKLDASVCEAIVEHTSFDNMRKNKMTNYEGAQGLDTSFRFMRRGQVGDWKNWFTEEQNKRFMDGYSETLNQVNDALFPETLVFE